MSGKEDRREFLKKALTFSVAASAVGSAVMSPAVSDAQVQPPGDNGVVRGHSPKREILYRITKHWEEYYKIAP